MASTDKTPVFWRVDADFIQPSTLNPTARCQSEQLAEETAGNYRRRPSLHNIRITPIYCTNSPPP